MLLLASISLLPVKNGGRLTHTDTDFVNAEFFFCDGMKDPWLKQLHSRSLIVRHAAWVALCATEQFVMPIADYTLDDRFDESNIIREPPGDVQLANSKSNQVIGKRPFDHEDDSRSERPNKRARVEDGESSANDLRAKPSAGDDSKKIGIPPQILKQKSVSQHVKKFESMIQPKRLSPPTNINVKGVPISTLDPHTLFWNDLFFKYFTRDQECKKKMTLKIDDLIDAPTVKAGIFTVNETFLGKKFINKDYE